MIWYCSSSGTPWNSRANTSLECGHSDSTWGKSPPPHYPVRSADLVAQLDAHGVVEEPPDDVLLDVLGGQPLQRLHAVELLGPEAVPVVAVVHLLEVARNPPELVLGEVDLQRREAVEQPAHHQLHDVERASDTVARQPLDVVRRTYRRRRLDRVPEDRPSVGHAGPEAGVHRDRHVHVGGRRPEPVVFRRRVVVAAGEGGDLHHLHPSLFTPMQLVQGGVQPPLGNAPHPDQPIRVRGAVLLHLPPVVGARQGQVRLVVLYPSARTAHAAHARVQHLGIHRVGVHLPQPLLRVPGPRHLVPLQPDRPELLRPLARVKVHAAPVDTALDQETVAAVRQLDAPGREPPVFLRDASRPLVGRHLDVGICRDPSVVSSHASSPPQRGSLA